MILLNPSLSLPECVTLSEPLSLRPHFPICEIGTGMSPLEVTVGTNWDPSLRGAHNSSCNVF